MSAPAPTTVLVLGAGASVAEALWHRPKRTGDHPPLDWNFFQRAPRHALEPLLNRVLRQARALGQADLCGSARPVSLEEHLGRLYFEMRTKPTEANVAAYYDLINLYADDLLATTSWMTKRSGPIRRVLQRELDEGRQVSVITFNHDLLIENALSMVSSARYGHVWCMQHAYGFPESIGVCANQREAFDWGCPGHRGQHIPLLKLHGSVNWVFRTRAAHPPAEASRRRRDLLVWTNRELPIHNRRLSGDKRDWYLWSLIVPPIYEKHGYIRDELQRVWDQAGVVLRAADRVVFWGYSFPRADVHARYFLQSAAQANRAIRKPVLINPDPLSQNELWTVIQPESVEHFRDVTA